VSAANKSNDSKFSEGGEFFTWEKVYGGGARIDSEGIVFHGRIVFMGRKHL